MTKQQAGRLGGMATFAKHGREHMRMIGARGAQVTRTRYVKVPYRQTEYAIVRRSDGIIIRIVSA